MGIARALLTKTLSLRDVVRDLAGTWRDEEADVCVVLADLFLGAQRIEFVVLDREPCGRGTVPVKWYADEAAVETRLRLAARNGLENVIVNVYRDDKKRSIPLADLIVRKSEIIRALADNPVPKSWLSAPRVPALKATRKLLPTQQDKHDFQAIASPILEANNTSQYSEIIRADSQLQAYKRKYRGRDTTKNWLREIDPHQGRRSIGRPRKRTVTPEK